jgi:hypothetical protein
MIKKYQLGEVYYDHYGNGNRCYANNHHIVVDWQDDGKTIILYYNDK